MQQIALKEISDQFKAQHYSELELEPSESNHDIYQEILSIQKGTAAIVSKSPEKEENESI